MVSFCKMVAFLITGEGILGPSDSTFVDSYIFSVNLRYV